jgi:hypothetical protein
MKFQVMGTLSALESIAVIGGIVFAVWQVLEISKQTTIQAETLKQSQQIASADLVLKLRATLDDAKFAKLVADIQNHDHAYPVLTRSEGGKGGTVPDRLIEQYISVFEDIGYLVEGDLIINKMAYNEFSYDVEKTWCNDDVQHIITDARKADKSITRLSDPIYGGIEKLASNYLHRENQTCKDLDNQ